MSSLPLADRLQSNSPDASSTWLPRSTTPLRITKRESSPQSHLPVQRGLGRRQSSSYNHVRNSNLVSKSPFKSQIPTSVAHTPSPRRVSGEKRPRPASMQTHENERPLGFKRRQSKAFQGLLEKEPVTKSPFRRLPSQAVSPPLPSNSPARPALVSKRLHGPRTVSNGSIQPRRRRRKTVTWDERCDVVEFERDEDQLQDDSAVSDSESDTMVSQEYANSEDSIENDEASDMVEWVKHDPSGKELPQTPRNSSIIPLNLNEEGPRTPHNSRFLGVNPDAEDGVPYGRSHHIQRAVAAHHRQEDLPFSIQSSSPTTSSPLAAHSEMPGTSTPPAVQTPVSQSNRSERVRDQHQEEAELEQDVQMLPPSPSPAKRDKPSPRIQSNEASVVPQFAIHFDQTDPEDDDDEDPFAMSHTHVEESLPGSSKDGEQSTSSVSDHPNNEEEEDLACDFTTAAVPDKNLDPSLSANHQLSDPISLSATASSNVALDAFQRLSTVDDVPDDMVQPHDISSALEQDFTTNEPDTARVEADGESPGDRLPQGTQLGIAYAEQETLPDNVFMKIDGLPYSFDVFGHGKNLAYSSTTSAIEQGPQLNDPPRHSHLVRQHTAESAADGRNKGVFEGLDLDFESGFALGDEGMSMAGGLNFGVDRDDMPIGRMSALDRLVEDVTSTHPALSIRRSVEGFCIEAVTPGIQATRLSFPLEVQADQLDHERANDAVNTDAYPHASFSDQPISRTPSASSIPPLPPPKDNIRTREELIKAKKRESRRREEEGELGMTAQFLVGESLRSRPRSHSRSPARADLGLGRPSRRRSMSTGDAEDMLAARSGVAMRRSSALRGETLLDVVPIEENEAPLADSIDHELKKMSESSSAKYHVRERELIYVASDVESVSHMNGVGDIDGSKAWKAVKRPSDMNEYAEQMREMRAQAKTGKAHGKVFVRVMGLKRLTLPLPQQQTTITCTLNNGIHFVTTPDCRLSADCKIDQEFELIEHSKLEFTLTIKVRRDPHIIAQFKANAPRPAPAPARATPPPPSKAGGMRAFFLGSSSPKKPAKASPEPIQTRPVPSLQENLARYLKQDGTLGRAFISFKDIAKHCDTKLFETSYPLIGQKSDQGPAPKTMQVGEIILQIFRLPPLPGIPPEQLPQSLEECHRGLRNVNWHKMTYFEGTLTQNGGDCTSWRRRQLRVIGANLVAFNDVTKRAMATIDLRKAIAVEDDRDDRAAVRSPDSRISQRSHFIDDCDGPYGVERSFRLLFPHDQQIIFFADTDDEKARWLEVLRALVGHIPPNPLWAEMLWQRQQEISKSTLLQNHHAS